MEFESDFILTKLRRKMGEQIIFHILVVEIAIIIVTLVSEWAQIAVPQTTFILLRALNCSTHVRLSLRRPSSWCVSGELDDDDDDDDDDLSIYMFKKFWNHSYGWVLMNPCKWILITS